MIAKVGTLLQSSVSCGVRVGCDGRNRTPLEKWISTPSRGTPRKLDARPVVSQNFATVDAEIELGRNRTVGCTIPSSALGAPVADQR